MFGNIKLYSSDSAWAGVLSDLGASVAKDGIKFPAPKKKILFAELIARVEELKAERLEKLGAKNLSESEQRLVLMLPESAAELKSEMGYAETSDTHTIETLVYNIRKKLGNDFIRLENGRYEL